MGQRTLDAAVHDGLAKLMKGVQVTHLLLDEEAEMMTFLAVHSDAQAGSGSILTLNVIYGLCGERMLEGGGSGVGLELEFEMRLSERRRVRWVCVCQTSVRVSEKAAGMAWWHGLAFEFFKFFLTPRGAACGLACRSL